MTAKTAIEVLKELVDVPPDIPSEVDGSLSCFFCGGYCRPLGECEHEPDCLYVRAKEIVNGEQHEDS